jgi:hypothetical protein
MRRKTKYEIVAVILVLIILTIIYWYATIPRMKYITLTDLVEIQYQPQPPPSTCSPPCVGTQACLAGVCTNAYPIFKYIFAKPLPDLAGGNVTIKSFTPKGVAANNAQLVNVLINGLITSNVPFEPIILSNTILASNVMPNGISQYLTKPMNISGTGSVLISISPSTS